MATITRFPQSRSLPPRSHQEVKNLGLGVMAKAIECPLEQTTGHWCSQCDGIWYGYLLEVACPACGNRHG